MLRYLKSFIWATPPSGPRVSILQLNGVITAPSPNPLRERNAITYPKVKAWADAAFAVPGVQAVALSINCPGGAPTQTEMIASYLRSKAAATKVPVLAFAQDVAASGGFWLLCAGDEVYACGTSMVGSIGVVSPNFGFVEALKKLGVERRILRAGISKVGLDPFSEVSSEQRAQAEQLMACLHSTFIDAVKARRAGKLKGQDSDIFSGRVWTGRMAVQVGLVDAVGDIDSVLRSRFGDNLDIRLFGAAKPPGLLSAWTARQAFAEDAHSGRVVTLVDSMWDAFQTRLLWAKYGL